jgi:hypothetical protein
MQHSRPFTAFSPVALRLGVCALVAACVLLPVSPPFAAGPASMEAGDRIPTDGIVFFDARAAGGTHSAEVQCSARLWEHSESCYLPATQATPARKVRVVSMERRSDDAPRMQQRPVAILAAN